MYCDFENPTVVSENCNGHNTFHVDLLPLGVIHDLLRRYHVHQAAPNSSIMFVSECHVWDCTEVHVVVELTTV